MKVFVTRKIDALLILMMVCLALACGNLVNEEQANTYVFATPAHIDESSYPNCIKVYEDLSKDLAIYFDTTYVPDKPDIGKEIESNTGDIKGTIVDSDEYSVYFKPNEETEIVQGDSGTMMYCDGEYVGFISSMTMDGIVRVICY